MQIAATPSHSATAQNRILIQDVLRWIAVLPAALGAYIGVQVAIVVARSFQTGFNENPDYWSQFLTSIAGPYCLVWAGAMTAPRHRNVTAITLAILYGIFTGVVMTLVIERGMNQSTYRWWDIVCYAAGIIATIVACVHFRAKSET